MTICDVFFDYEIEHRPKHARNSVIQRVSEIFPVEIADISSNDAPVAIIKREVGQPDFLYRSINGRLFRPAHETDAHGTKAIDSVSFAEKIKTATAYSNKKRRHNPFATLLNYSDNPFATGMNMYRTPSRTGSQIGEIRRDDRELAIAEVNKRALDVAFIDGAAWRIANEPVIAVSRWRDGGGGRNAGATESSARRIFGAGRFLTHGFGIDRQAEAAAFLHEHLLPHAAGETGAVSQWEIACARHEGKTLRAIPTYEIRVPEMLLFDEAACCKAQVSDRLPDLLEKMPMGDFNRLPLAAMEAWFDLRRLSEATGTELTGIRDALGRLAESLPQIVSTQSNDPLFFLRMNAIDVCQRIDFLHSYLPTTVPDDGLDSLIAQ